MYKLFLQFCMCIRIDIDWQGLSYRKSHIPHTCTQWSVCFIHSRNWSYWLPPTLIHKLSLPDKPHIIPFCTAITPGINAIISVMSIKVPRILVKLCFYTSLLLFLHDSPHMGFILKFIFFNRKVFFLLRHSYSSYLPSFLCFRYRNPGSPSAWFCKTSLNDSHCFYAWSFDYYETHSCGTISFSASHAIQTALTSLATIKDDDCLSAVCLWS